MYEENYAWNWKTNIYEENYAWKTIPFLPEKLMVY